MFILRNFLLALIPIIGMVIKIAYWLVIIRALISWVNPDPRNPIVQFLYRVTEPMLAPFRRIIPAYNIGIDLSPLIVIIVLIFLDRFLISTLYDLASLIR